MKKVWSILLGVVVRVLQFFCGFCFGLVLGLSLNSFAQLTFRGGWNGPFSQFFLWVLAVPVILFVVASIVFCKLLFVWVQKSSYTRGAATFLAGAILGVPTSLIALYIFVHYVHFNFPIL